MSHVLQLSMTEGRAYNSNKIHFGHGLVQVHWQSEYNNCQYTATRNPGIATNGARTLLGAPGHTARNKKPRRCHWGHDRLGGTGCILYGHMESVLIEW